MSLSASDIHLTKSSSMDEIVDALSRYRHDARVVQEALDSLRDQLLEDAKVHRARGPAPRIRPIAVPIIVSVMKQHQQIETLQKCACEVLGYFAAHHYTIPELLTQYQAFPEIVAAMKEHVDSAPVQEQACLVILNATASSPLPGFEDILRECITAIVEAGTIPRIIAALERHVDSAIVQENACRSLLHLIIEGEGTKIVQAGAVPYFVVAMQKHPDDFDVNETASEALNNLAENNHLDTIAQSKDDLVIVLAAAIQKFDLEPAKELLPKIQPNRDE